MFNREHHVRIAAVLKSMNPEILSAHRCYFGGGTAIVLLKGEYRESIDIDFLVSDKAGYRDLRNLLKTSQGLRPLCREDQDIKLSRELRIDQYGVRTMIDAGSTEIKFEIVNEGRVSLEEPSISEKICGISTLSLLDMATSKLLANSDRWFDRSTFYRDLIDLAMLDLSRDQLDEAMEKATAAYGSSVASDLNKAINQINSQAGHLEECMSALKMDRTPPALLWSRIRSLR